MVEGPRRRWPRRRSDQTLWLRYGASLNEPFCSIVPVEHRQGLRMVSSDSLAEFLREQLGPLGAVTMRRMFGKTGVFCDGVMFGMVTENTLYFRVDDQNQV